MINVLIIEDSTVFVMGLKLALAGQKEIHFVEQVSTSGAAVAYLNAHPEVDIALVDISLEQPADGLTLLGILRDAFPHVPALVLSNYKTPAYIIQSITYGAKAYLAKDSDPSEIAEAILRVYEGDSIFFGETLPSRDIIRIFGGETNLKARRPQTLSPKELEVLQLVTSGYSNSQIAAAMDISKTTVDTYKERIKDKFGLDTLIECVAHAVVLNLVVVR